MGGQLRTHKLSLADAGGEGGDPSIDIVPTLRFFLYCGFPYINKFSNTPGLPWQGEQVLQQLLVVLRLGSLPPWVLSEGEQRRTPPVPAPGQQHQLLLHLPAHVSAPQASHRPWSREQHPAVLRGKVRVGPRVVVYGPVVVVAGVTAVSGTAVGGTMVLWVHHLLTITEAFYPARWPAVYWASHGLTPSEGRI